MFNENYIKIALFSLLASWFLTISVANVKADGELRFTSEECHFSVESTVKPELSTNETKTPIGKNKIKQFNFREPHCILMVVCQEISVPNTPREKIPNSQRLELEKGGFDGLVDGSLKAARANREIVLKGITKTSLDGVAGTKIEMIGPNKIPMVSHLFVRDLRCYGFTFLLDPNDKTSPERMEKILSSIRWID
ncbi:MAG: hypothetical protein K1Y36_26120 [Blastocatellia bacterium]|nr:hypothetical protein [Blastocatellia bacterium]